MGRGRTTGSRSTRSRVYSAAAPCLAALAAFGLAPAARGQVAGDAAGGRDRPPLLLPRLEQSEVAEFRSQAFEAVHLPKARIADRGGRARDPGSFLAAEGRVTRTSFRLPPGASAADAFRKYQDALADAGFTERVFACEREACGGSFLAEARWGRVGPLNGQPRYVLARRPVGGVLAAVLAFEADGAAAAFDRAAVQLTLVEPPVPAAGGGGAGRWVGGGRGGGAGRERRSGRRGGAKRKEGG